MGDNIKDPFGNGDGEERELERPHTPDYHDGREEDEQDEEVFSEVSDDRTHEQQEDESNIQSPVHPVADSPVSEVGDEATEEQCVEDAKEEEEKGDEELIESEENDLEESEDEEKGKEHSKDDETNQDKSIPDEKTLEEKELISSEEGTLQETSEESADKTKKDVGKDVKEEEDEDLEMPLSPIGDLGLSEPEAAIVDDILKGDVSEMMPGEKTENKQDDDDRDDNEEQSAKEGEEEDEEAKHSPDEDENDSIKEAKSENQDIQDEDEERSEPEEAGDQLIADIFGASDEEEEFEGFEQEDIELSKAKQEGSKRSSKVISDDEDEGVTGEVDDMVVPKPKKDKSKDEGDSDDEGPRKQVWDFDVMMEQKKASRSRRRRKHDGDLINDNDDLVVEMIKQMQQAAEEDRMLNEGKQAATKKLKFLPVVLKHLNKADLQFTFIDSGILNAIKDWLSPLPDGSLPHLQIRTGLLRMLSAFPALDTGALKMSGLGKAVMCLYRHPKEIRQNKDMAGKLINEWARPIFGVTSNFKSMSREEREERDYQNMSKRRRLSSTDEGSKTPRSIDRALHGEKKAARPGEKGFIMRARVPAPSNKDYVVRPKSNLDNMDFRRNAPKLLSRVDKQMRKFKDRNKAKDATLVSISIEGRKMAL